MKLLFQKILNSMKHETCLLNNESDSQRNFRSSTRQSSDAIDKTHEQYFASNKHSSFGNLVLIL